MGNSTLENTLSKRTAGGKFHNPAGSPKRDYGAATMMSFLWGQMKDRQLHRPDEDLMLAGAEARAGLAAASNPSVTWLGHACFLIRMAGLTILIDPYLSKTAGLIGIGPKRFVPAPIAAEDLPPIDILLLSHNHYDHLDLETLRKLGNKDRMSVITTLGLAPYFTRLGYRNVTELDWWQKQKVGGVEVEALPAVHFSGRGPFDSNKTLWASFAIRGDDLALWFSGDTATGDIFHEIGQQSGPFDLAMVGIGAYEPRAIMKSSHANPEEAIGIVQAVRAKRAIGMHWGTVKLTPEDPFEAPVRFKAAASLAGYGEDNAWTMKIGETRNLADIRA
jgi:L-ascorbate metabolism protein UlaG (beta-lactamase superfamily)